MRSTCPSSYLAKVFQLLAKAGLVKSFRGAKGGYRLALPPESITLKHITQAIEGANPLLQPPERAAANALWKPIA